MRHVLTQLLVLLGWLVAAAMGTLALTQAFGVTHFPLVYAAQALTVPLLAPAIPLAAVALWIGARSGDRPTLALGAVCVGISASLVVLVAPTVPPMFGRTTLPRAAAAPRITVAVGNVYFDNPTPERAVAAMLATDADVLVVVEYSGASENEFTAQGADQRYVHRIGTPSDRRNGLAIYSRFPLVNAKITPVGDQDGIDATLDVDGTPMRLLVVHPLPGRSPARLGQLERDIRTIGDVASEGDIPTAVLGDVNASRFHPALRQLLGDFSDVHEALGQGLSASWPTNRRVPPFVRLDHALVSGRMTATSVRDIGLPGSDHSGFVVELGLAASD